MFTKFQGLIKNILENMNVAGDGGAFGGPQPGYEISNPTSLNQDRGYTDNIKAAMATALPNKPKKGKKKKKKFPVIRRNLSKGGL